MFHYQYEAENIVSMQFKAGCPDGEADLFFTFLDSLLAKEQKFYLIFYTDGMSGFSPEKRRQLSLWFKNESGKLKKSCLGLVRIVPNMTLKEKFSSLAYKKMMPFPYHVTIHLHDALKWIRER